jgi:hypothetical protein
MHSKLMAMVSGCRYNCPWHEWFTSPLDKLMHRLSTPIAVEPSVYDVCINLLTVLTAACLESHSLTRALLAVLSGAATIASWPMSR